MFSAFQKDPVPDWDHHSAAYRALEIPFHCSTFALLISTRFALCPHHNPRPGAQHLLSAMMVVFILPHLSVHIVVPFHQAHGSSWIYMPGTGCSDHLAIHHKMLSWYPKHHSRCVFSASSQRQESVSCSILRGREEEAGDWI